jgi:RimJ/RimL family protein N-acetyltransferase
MVQFHQSLSEQSVYLRYFHMIGLSQRVAHERLIRICFIDYDREMALVAERRNAGTGAREILDVGRLSKRRGANEAEFAVLVSDRFHHQGLGTELVRRLLQVGRAEKLDRITAEILPENRAHPPAGTRQISQELGFRLDCSAEQAGRSDGRSLPIMEYSSLERFLQGGVARKRWGRAVRPEQFKSQNAKRKSSRPVRATATRVETTAACDPSMPALLPFPFCLLACPVAARRRRRPAGSPPGWRAVPPRTARNTARARSGRDGGPLRPAR